MKRFIQLLALLVLSFTATSCGSSDEDVPEEPIVEEPGVYTAIYCDKVEMDGEDWYLANVRSSQTPFPPLGYARVFIIYEIKDYSGIELEPGDKFQFKLNSYKEMGGAPFIHDALYRYITYISDIEIIKKL